MAIHSSKYKLERITEGQAFLKSGLTDCEGLACFLSEEDP